MTHNMRLSDPWFAFVASGHKRYEGRRRTEKTEKIQKGDVIRFQRVGFDDFIFVTVVDVHPFDSFESALETLGVLPLLPNVDSVDEGVKVYQQYVSLETQKSDGVLCIEIEY